MFKKLISNLPFNPSLISQVSFYAKRLHKEERLRRLGVIMVVFSIFIQMFAVISPPEPTLAQSDNDIIRGGFRSKEEAVSKCRANVQGFATILNYYGVDCDLLASDRTREYTIKSTDNNGYLDSLGRVPQGPKITRTGKNTDEYPVNIPGAGTFYMRNLWAWDSGAYSSYRVLAPLKPNGESIMIMFNCGNIITNDRYKPPTNIPPPSPPPSTPGNAVCSSLVATPVDERRYRFKATTAGSDYTVKSYTFDFGNGKTQTINTSSKTHTTDHAYDAPGSYTASVRVQVEVKNSNGSTSARTLQCQASVAPTTRDECPLVEGTQTSKSECDVCPNIPGEQSSSIECKPCDNSQNDQDVEACLVLTKAARNNTQNIDNADGTIANADDSITYTLRTKNIGKTTVKGYVIEENISDILDYATVTNLGGGTLGDDNVVRWPATDISNTETVTKQLSVKIKNPIPQTPISASDPAKFDLVMNNVYGNAVNIKLPTSVVKTTETVTRSLPKTGPGETLALSMMMTVVVSYFLARARLLAKEMDMVQVDYVTSGSY